MITVWTNHQKVDKSISSYAIIYFDHSFYVFGGESMYDTQNKHPTTIARLDTVTTAWSKVGDMTSWKRYHRVIHDGTYFIVVGVAQNMVQTENMDTMKLEDAVL